MSREMYLKVKALAAAIDALIADGKEDNLGNVMMLSQILNEELEEKDETGNFQISG